MQVWTEIISPEAAAQKIQNDDSIKGVILSGGARSVYEKNAPKLSRAFFDCSLPILGICYGHQLIAHMFGGKVNSGKAGEYGITDLFVQKSDPLLLHSLPAHQKVWMNHRDIVVRLSAGFVSLAHTAHSPIAAFANPDRKIFGVQFHPEVTHTQYGMQIFKNFVFQICHAKKSWTTSRMKDDIVQEAKEVIGDRKALIGLSGGIDSSVAAVLLSKAISNKLIAVYVDTGLMRVDDTAYVRKVFQTMPLALRIIDAKKQFFRALKGVEDPEKKRKIIGKLFVDIFSAIAKKEKSQVLVQGTIYSDRIESGLTAHSATIKSHHNVGGLPKNLKLEVYEPLRELYKDEVRTLARALKLPKVMLTRQVFPGPGLAVRIIGEVVPTRVQIVRQASAIIEEELKKTLLWKKLWMSFAVLLPIRSVGIQGDARSYKYPVVVRILESKDAMTANFAKIPFEILEKISTRITNEVREVNRVVYDITNKPPATMEWE